MPTSDDFEDDDPFESEPPRRTPKRRPPPKSDSDFVDFLTFRRMIMPLLVQIMFWLGVVACVVQGIRMLYLAFNLRFGQAEVAGLGLLIMFAGPLFVRMYCELCIVMFRMNDTLTDIKNILRKQSR